MVCQISVANVPQHHTQNRCFRSLRGGQCVRRVVLEAAAVVEVNDDATEEEATLVLVLPVVEILVCDGATPPGRKG